jgi:uncharacterized protein
MAEMIDMEAHGKRLLVLLAGWGFLLLGVIGLILPVLHGTLFVLVGLVILSSQYAWARLSLMKLRKRFPKAGRAADALVARATTWFRRFAGRKAGDERR